MKALIFGSSGQDGYYLTDLLHKENIDTIGISRSIADIVGSVEDYKLVSHLISENHPAYVFHLAANSTSRHEALLENHETICTGSLNILESVRQHSPQTKVFLSGSGLQFENNGSPINENTPFNATSAYAVSRIHSVYAARYFRKLGVRAYVGYFFHHDSPRRSERHLSKMIAEATKRIAKGSNEKIMIGDLSARKEWGYAEDIMQGVWKFVQQYDIFEAVIGTGKAYSVEDWLDACFKLIGRNWRDYVTPKEDFQAEFKILVSEPYLINSIGWKPKQDLESLSKLMVTGNLD